MKYIILFFIYLIVICSVQSEVISYQQGGNNLLVTNYQGMEDNLLVGTNTRHDDNQGGYEHSIVGNSGWGTYDPPVRTIMRWDLSSLNTQYTNIESVSLTLNVSNTANSGTLSVYALSSANKDWAEGTSFGYGIKHGESCWWYKAWDTNGNHVPWAGGVDSGAGVAGVDYNSTALGTLQWNASTSGLITINFDGWSNTQLNNLIDLWVGSQSENAGIILINNIESNGTRLLWGAKERADIDERPMLSITYSNVPEPSTLFMTVCIIVISLKILKK